MAHLTLAENLSSLESEDVLTAGALGFMPRIAVVTTLPHRRPESRQFKRVNGRHSLAIDLYVWLTYRMSYLKQPTLIPWNSLQAQFGADYSRPRDFRRKTLSHLETVVTVYPTVRLSQTNTGLLSSQEVVKLGVHQGRF